MFFQGNHAIAAAEQEQFVQHLEQVVVGGAAMRCALQGSPNPLDNVEQHFLGGHDDEGTRRATDDNQHFVHERVEQHLDVAAFQHEPAEDADDHRKGANDDDHARRPVVARRDRPDSKRCR